MNFSLITGYVPQNRLLFAKVYQASNTFAPNDTFPTTEMTPAEFYRLCNLLFGSNNPLLLNDATIIDNSNKITVALTQAQADYAN